MTAEDRDIQIPADLYDRAAEKAAESGEQIESVIMRLIEEYTRRG